jgi:hypothetical protein
MDTAKYFHNAYAVHQTHADKKPGKLVEYSPTAKEWDNFPSLMENLHFMDAEGAGVALVTLPSQKGKQKGLHYEFNDKRFSISKHSNADYLQVKVSSEGAVYYH